MKIIKEIVSCLQTLLILLLVYYSYQEFKIARQGKALACSQLIKEYEYLKNKYSENQDYSLHLPTSSKEVTKEEEMRAFYYKTLLQSSAEREKAILSEKKQLAEQYCNYDAK